MIVQNYVRMLKDQPNTPYRIIERDLYEIFLSLLSDKRILDKIPDMENKKGRDFLLKQLQNIAQPKNLIERMDYQPHEPGRDVLFMTGTGKDQPVYAVSQDIGQHAVSLRRHTGGHVLSGKFNGDKLELFDRFLTATITERSI